MEPIWIILVAVAVIIVAMGVAIGVRRHRSDDYGSHLDVRDRADYTQDAQTAAAARYSDRAGSGAGSGVV
jgi:hypothetical protein